MCLSLKTAKPLNSTTYETLRSVWFRHLKSLSFWVSLLSGCLCSCKSAWKRLCRIQMQNYVKAPSFNQNAQVMDWGEHVNKADDAVQPGAGQCTMQDGIKVVVVQNTSSGFQRTPYTCDQYSISCFMLQVALEASRAPRWGHTNTGLAKLLEAS